MNTQTPQQTPTRYGYQRSLVTDWRELAEGDSVVLLRPELGSVPLAGRVDAISADGTLMWLLQGGCEGRRLFHRQDGYKTLLDPPASAS